MWCSGYDVSLLGLHQFIGAETPLGSLVSGDQTSGTAWMLTKIIGIGVWEWSADAIGVRGRRESKEDARKGWRQRGDVAWACLFQIVFSTLAKSPVFDLAGKVRREVVLD